MNVERDSDNTLLVTARQVSGETHYLLVFTRVDNNGVSKCVTTNSGSTSGPLLLTFTETDSPTATAGEVELVAGDWSLIIYGQSSSTNLDTTLADRTIWSELISVSGAGGQMPGPDTGGSCPLTVFVTVDGTLEETLTDVDPCDENTVTIAITYN